MKSKAVTGTQVLEYYECKELKKMEYQLMEWWKCKINGMNNCREIFL